MGAEKPGGKALVYSCEQEQHHGAANVDVPVGNGPVSLGAVRVELVWLTVSSVVDLLADARDEQRRCSAYPRIEAGGHVFRFIAQLGNSLPPFRVRDDDQALPLAEARTRG